VGGRPKHASLQRFADYEEPRFLDITAGSRNIYLNGEVDGLADTVCLDIDISVRPHVCADHRMLPFRDGCFERVVFDPPFLVKPYRNVEPVRIIGKFSYYRSRSDQLNAFSAVAAEARRVLRPGGVLLMKYMEWGMYTERNLRVETVEYIMTRAGLELVGKKSRPNRFGSGQPVYWLTFRRPA